jgi:hypothetical protein
VRTAVGVALVTVCLGLAGCSLFGKKRTAQNDNPKPFLGSQTPAKAETAALPHDNGGPLPGANGVLAGRVIVEATGRPLRAYILIKNRDREDPKSELDITTNDEGFFYIPKLNVGDTYELAVRANENGEVISNTSWVKPPNPTLLIRLDKRFTTPSTPKLKDMPPSVPDKKGAPNPGKESTEGKPAVSIDPPVKLSEQEPQPRRGNAVPPPESGSGTSSGGGGAPPNPANIANGDFQRITPPSVPVDIPNGKPWPPPVPGSPQWQGVPEQSQPARSAPAVQGTSGSVLLPNIPTPAPSIGLYGNKLDNFALHDLDGKVWEYKLNRHGRLLLLDFWYHNCQPCLQAIHYLRELQNDYGRFGLEIIGIACETGSLEQQRDNVRGTRTRYQINYTTLLSGGGPGHCPVIRNFQVEYYPTLVLIDTDGTILWRSGREGMDENEHYRLRKRIEDRLVTRQPPP